MSSGADQPPPSAERERRGLIFHWFVAEGRGWQVIFSSIAAALFFGGLMLLFQVVYPAASRRHLAVQHFTWLDPGSTQARLITDAVSDRDFLIMPDSALPPLKARQMPVFTPGFKDFELRVRDFLETSAQPTTMPRIFRPDDAPLPPVNASPHPMPPQPKPQTLRATVISGLADRRIVKPVEAPRPEAASIGFRIAVAENGRITTAVPLSAESTLTDVIKEVRPLLDRLRFEPAAQPGLQWGVVAFRWQENAAP